MPDKLVEILAYITGLPPERIVPGTQFHIYCDDYDMVELTMMIKEEYGISIPEDELLKLYTAGDLQAYIEKAV